MKKYRVYGLLAASIFIGEYEAKSEDDAIEMSFKDDSTHSVSLCHHCSKEVDIGDVYEYEADEVE